MQSRTWKRFIKNKPAIFGVVVIALAIIIAILGYTISPDSTPYANDMILPIGAQSPGYKCTMLLLPKEQKPEKVNFLKKMWQGEENQNTWQPIAEYSIANNKLLYKEKTGSGRIGMEKDLPIHEVLGFYTPSPNFDSLQYQDNNLVLFKNGNTTKWTLQDIKQKIDKEHIQTKKFYLGTDKFGRDILSRLIIGVRVSLSVGLIAVLISLVIGVSMGALAGYFRGWVDDIISWLINVIWSIPTLLLIFAITLAFGKGFGIIFLAVGLTMWVEVARIIRGQVMSLREKEFVEAARGLGYSHFRILVWHILPNVIGPVMVIAASNFATAIIVEAGLSFLGIGVQPPQPSWGSMMKENFDMIIGHNPILAVLPGIAIMILVLAFNFLGNGLRDALDVKGK